MDFSADGSYLIASCEFSGQLVKVDVAPERVVGTLTLPDGAPGMPQDVKLSPDGRIFYVADMRASGVWEVDGDACSVIGFIHTGAGAHGLYPSRNGKVLYVTNRSAGSISVISFATRKVVANVADPRRRQPRHGRRLGRTARCSGSPAATTASSTRSRPGPGSCSRRSRSAQGPHGLCVWPQPGRYSLGHTGILR